MEEVLTNRSGPGIQGQVVVSGRIDRNDQQKRRRCESRRSSEIFQRREKRSLRWFLSYYWSTGERFVDDVSTNN